MSTTPRLSPTVFMPAVRGGDLPPLDGEAPARIPAPLADATPGSEHDADHITGISLTFAVSPLGGATAARRFEPFVLP